MAMDRILRHFKRAADHTDDRQQHAAIVELLVLAVYADKTVDVSELEALDKFDASHADWDDQAFSIQEYLGPATAKVRAAIDEDGSQALLEDIGGRITSPELREAAIGYCEDIVGIDGVTDEESEFVKRVRQMLSTGDGS
jgi:hypothetical protein